MKGFRSTYKQQSILLVSLDGLRHLHHHDHHGGFCSPDLHHHTHLLIGPSPADSSGQQHGIKALLKHSGSRDFNTSQNRRAL
jgi:hypothetical protein